MADNEVKEGDKVSWQWGGGAPGGTATEVKEQGAVTMETKSGNEVKKNAEPDNPAVYIERSGHDVVKKASELQVTEPGPEHKEGADSSEKKAEASDEKKDEQMTDAANGEKKEEEKKSEAEEEKKDEANGEQKDESAATTGEKRKAEEPAEEKKDEEAETKKQKTDDAEPEQNGDEAAPKKKGRPPKSAAGSKKEKAKKPAATETGEPRRSGRVASLSK